MDNADDAVRALAAKRVHVKKVMSQDEGRRRRDEAVVKLRKEKREEGLQKRRAVAAAADAVGATPVGAGAAASSLPAEASLENLHVYVAGE
jgi:hypothetical protein